MKRFNIFTRLLSMVLVTLLCIAPSLGIFAQAEEADDNTAYYYGDLNDNGDIEKYDYILVKRYCLNTVTLSEDQLLRGDVNKNGSIEKYDYILIKRHCLKTFEISKIELGCKHNDIVTISATEATCTENGNTAYFYCEGCKKFFSDATAETEIAIENTVLPAKGHDTVFHKAVEATCTEDGNVAYYSCNGCEKFFADEDAKNEIKISEIYITAPGHTEVTDERVEPSCSKEGLTEGKHCDTCDKVLVAQTAIPKTNHTPGEKSCTEDQICTVCKDVIETAKGHVPGTNATCTEDQICLVCETLLQPAKGHTLKHVPEKAPVDKNDPGNCEYWECEVCKKCFLNENGTQEIPREEISWKLFKVTYYCDEMGSKQTKWYKVGEEVEELIRPQIDGYIFKYWVDGNGKRINSISENNTENIELYAVVELEIYTIYLGGTWKYDTIKYTINDQVDLPIPVEDGLTFANWRDTEGKAETYIDKVGIRRWRIPKGTTGDIELMAQWKDNRNLIVPDERDASERYINSGYDEKEKVYWFLYSLGEIQNVVLDPENSLIKTKHNGGYIAGSLTLAETTTVEKSLTESVATSISTTVTSSTNWSQGSNWEDTLSVGQDVNVTVGSEVGADFAKVKAEMSVGISLEASSTAGGSFEIGGGSDESNSNSETIETTLAYNTSISQSKERTISFTHDVAPGNYYYANVGTVKVYAFIVFDPVKKSYELETINILNPETTTAVLSDEKKDREYVSDEFLYDFDIIGIRDEVTDNYFVQYFANNRTTDNIVKMYPIDTDVKLENNPFSFTGYTYVNWATAYDVKYSAGQTVNNIAEPGKLLVLDAQWSANAYTIKYDANKPSNASNSVTGMPSNITTAYDKNVTLGSKPSLLGWTFGGWYSDKACTKKVGDATATTKNLVSSANGSITLYAKWTANTYTITYEANGGSGTTTSTKHTVDTKSKLAESKFTRSNYTCVGWAWSKDSVTPDFTAEQEIVNQNYTANATITLYAIWVKTTASASSGGRDKEINAGSNNGHKEYLSLGMNREALKANGYKTISIVLKVDGYENWVFLNPGPIVKVYNRSGSVVAEKDESGTGWDSSWTERTFKFTVSTDVITDDGKIQIGYFAKNEIWHLGTVDIEVKATK